MTSSTEEQSESRTEPSRDKPSSQTHSGIILNKISYTHIKRNDLYK